MTGDVGTSTVRASRAPSGPYTARGQGRRFERCANPVTAGALTANEAPARESAVRADGP
ncbi:hypothetical protein OHT57_43440 [Streptomyces sp. NBC_00285]|uniref:hypothetical protein n=1 Tax=Streptomyces sp. NBC_00285 TaxID=2975700 RepID=UPI002E2A7461|nr:hypothetical protein [Streptomyces sp. NBC_00285]